ncbi:MAG: Type III pantothenate kinase [Firmicutes bacterium]|nr:Type III pantothenate kinase [Bacillota bacterium]
MNLFVAVNIGNTRTSVGFIDDRGRVGRVMALATTRYAEEYASLRQQIAEGARVVCASVVPQATLALAEALGDLPIEVLAVRDDLGITFAGVNYAELGPDLFANALASWSLWGQDSLNVDLGTGSTFCVIKKGVYLGTAIVPGMELSFTALMRRAALLTEVPLAKPRRVINANTVECLQAGIYYGYLELVRGLIRRVQEEQGKLRVILTGGIGTFLQDGLGDVIDVYEPNLTLLGIWVAAKRLVSARNENGG